MITHVLDTSAILAHYLQEPGAADVNGILSRGSGVVGLSLVTLVELRGRLTELATDPQEVDRVFKLYTETLATRLPFTPQTMTSAIELRATSGHGCRWLIRSSQQARKSMTRFSFTVTRTWPPSRLRW